MSSPQHAASVLHWITNKKTNQHLTRIILNHLPQPLRELHCPGLKDLRVLEGSSLQLGAAGGYRGVIMGCTNLTRLQLVVVDLTDVPEGGVLDSLSCLVKLQHLVVEPTRPADVSGATLRSNKLEHMKLMLSQENLLQLGTFSCLRLLQLRTADDVIAVGPDSVPGLMLPASLTELFLRSPVQVALLSLVPTTLRDLRITCDVEGPAAGPGSFLSCLDRLQQLTCLILGRGSSFSWPPPGVAYSALTARSSLVHLQVWNMDPGGPDAIWQYVFRSGRQLPHLTYFRHAMVSGFTAWSVLELRSLISCCPSLCDLGSMWLQAGVHLSELHMLTALTGLHVLDHFNDLESFEEFVQGLPVITQLRRLVFDSNEQVPTTSLLPLTSLTLLTRLQLTGLPDDAQPVNDGPPLLATLLCFVSKDASTPDVWRQLLRCAAKPAWLTALCNLARQLACCNPLLFHMCLVAALVVLVLGFR